MVEDEVVYDNITPWPLITTSQSLKRVSPTFFGNSRSAWTATAASPGTIAFSPGVTGDLNAVGIHWQQTGDCLRWEQGNFDGNDVVDAADLDAALDPAHRRHDKT